MTIPKLIHCFGILDKIFQVTFKERLAKPLLLQTRHEISENMSQWNPIFLYILCSKKHFTELISWEVLRKKKTFRKIFEIPWSILTNEMIATLRYAFRILSNIYDGCFFTERANSIQPLTIFWKNFILVVWQSFEYAFWTYRDLLLHNSK